MVQIHPHGFSYFVGLVGFGSVDVKSKNKHGDMYKVVLLCLKTATVILQLNGKHIGFIPNLLFKGDCWRIWLGRCHEKGTVN